MDDGLSLFQILGYTIRDISFWTGLAAIVAFSQGRFNEKQLDYEELDPPLPARSFTSRFRYYSAAALYTCPFAFLYIALITLGSKPEFQGVLKQLFGSFDSIAIEPGTANGDQAAIPNGGAEGGGGAIPNETQEVVEIGTPAWAAMVLMMVAPTLAWFRNAEFAFRLWLQDFSNVPYMARSLAEDILNCLFASRKAGGVIEYATDVEMSQVFADLQEVHERLLDDRNLRRKDRYLRAFLPHEDLLKRTVRRFTFLTDELNVARSVRLTHGATENGEHPEPGAGEPADLPTTQELLILARRYVRLVACVLLEVEAEEYYARHVLRRIPRLENLPLSEFRFSRTQVLIGIAMIILLASFTGPLVSWLVTLNLEAKPTPQEIWEIIFYWFWWGVVAAAAFILPLVFAAAVQLYLIDRKYFRDDEGDSSAVSSALAIGLVGYYGLALLPLTAFEAWRAAWQGAELHLLNPMLLALIPAIVSLLYNWLSLKNFAKSRTSCFFIDFAIFAAVAGAVAGLIAVVQVFIYLAGADVETFEYFGILLRYRIPEIVTPTIIAASFGAMQCAVSRQAKTWAEEEMESRTQRATPLRAN